MAEAIVTGLMKALVTGLLEKSGSLIAEGAWPELQSFLGLHKEVQKLESTLIDIQAVLEDAEKRQVEAAVKRWLDKLKEAANDIDNVLDELETAMIKSKIQEEEEKAETNTATAKAASLDKIASLVKNDVLTMEGLVREMQMYLTTTDNIVRARGILLLAEVLTCLATKPLDNATLHSLIGFFTDRLADWKALRGALVGCLALMRRKSSAGVVTSTDAKAVAESFLQNLQVQSLGQHDRKLCFELLECLLERYPNTVTPMGDELIYGICEAVDSEKDPQCLMLTFHIVEVLVQLFPDTSGPFASFAGDLFEILSCYFPIHFTHPRGEDLGIKRDDLSRALMTKHQTLLLQY